MILDNTAVVVAAMGSTTTLIAGVLGWLSTRAARELLHGEVRDISAALREVRVGVADVHVLVNGKSDRVADEVAKLRAEVQRLAAGGAPTPAPVPRREIDRDPAVDVPAVTITPTGTVAVTPLAKPEPEDAP